MATLRIAERVYSMVFRLQSRGTAVVEPRGDLADNPLLDAAFGTRTERDAPIQEEFDLEQLEATIPPLTVEIRDDFRSEDEECFTIRIFAVYFQGHRNLLTCNEDDFGATNYFCETTTCIMDNDGSCSSKFFP